VIIYRKGVKTPFSVMLDSLSASTPKIAKVCVILLMSKDYISSAHLRTVLLIEHIIFVFGDDHWMNCYF